MSVRSGGIPMARGARGSGALRRGVSRARARVGACGCGVWGVVGDFIALKSCHRGAGARPV